MYSGCIELMPIHTEMVMALMSTAKWFGNIFFENPESVCNDHAVLALYGMGGSGKTRIASAISNALNG